MNQWLLTDAAFSTASKPAPGQRINTVAELTQVLGRLIHQEPRVVIIDLPNDECFIVGIHSEFGCIEWTKAEDEGDFITSPSSPQAEPEMISFLWGGTPSPIGRENLIPIQEVITALGEYFESGAMPSEIEWEMS